MIIEGTNLIRTKKALIAYLTYCAREAIDATDTTAADWETEIKATESLLSAVEENIKRDGIPEGG